MFTKRNQRGLTLIEIVMSLAIAGLLAASVLTGRDALRAKLQFSQGIDQVSQILTTARGETSGTVGSTDLATGGASNPPVYIFGKSVHFSNHSSNVTVSTVLINSAGTITSSTTNPYTVTIPWGVVPTADDYVVFGLGSSGQLQVYNLGVTPPSPGGAVSTLPVGPAAVNFSGTGTETATVTADSVGNVTRVINE